MDLRNIAIKTAAALGAAISKAMAPHAAKAHTLTYDKGKELPITNGYLMGWKPKASLLTLTIPGSVG